MLILATIFFIRFDSLDWFLRRNLAAQNLHNHYFKCGYDTFVCRCANGFANVVHSCGKIE